MLNLALFCLTAVSALNAWLIVDLYNKTRTAAGLIHRIAKASVDLSELLRKVTTEMERNDAAS